MAPKTLLDNGTGGGEPSLSSGSGSLPGGAVGKPLLLLALLAAAIFCLRLAAPPNLMDQDQERPASYVLDAVRNGHWLCQRDLSGEIASKPPLWTWLSALTTLVCGRICVFSLYLPGALAALGVAWCILTAGRKYFGLRAAFFGALASLLTTAGLKQFGLARTDAVFAFTVCAAAFLAFRAWALGRGWLWFWLMAAAATLAKGPLGLVVAGGGLLACWWERRTGEPWPLRGSQWVGVSCFLLLTAGWLALSYHQLGPSVISKLLDQELRAQAVTKYEGHLPGTMFWQPPLYYLARAAPWSLLAYFGLWRLCKWPAPEPTQRRFERFLFCWFCFGLLLFSLAPHQRGDLLWPIMPAGALLAGRELDRLVQKYRPAVVYRCLAAFALLAFAGFAFYYCGPRARTTLVRQTVGLKHLAAAVEQRGGREFALTHFDDPVTLQIYLNTLRAPVASEMAAQLLRGREAAFVAVRNLAKLKAARLPEDPPFYTNLFAEAGLEHCPVHIVSNRPELEPTNPIALGFGSLIVKAYDAHLLEATEKEFRFSPNGVHATVSVRNTSAQARRVQVGWVSARQSTTQSQVLPSQESWTVTPGPQP